MDFFKFDVETTKNNSTKNHPGKKEDLFKEKKHALSFLHKFFFVTLFHGSLSLNTQPLGGPFFFNADISDLAVPVNGPLNLGERNSQYNHEQVKLVGGFNPSEKY